MNAAVKAQAAKLMEDGRERTATDVSDWFRRNGMIVGSVIASDVMMDLVEDGVLSFDEVSRVRVWRLRTTEGLKGLRKCIEAVAEAHGVAVSDIRGRRKSQSLAQARQAAMYEARQLGFSFPEIADAILRDPSTVRHGVRAYQARMEGDRRASA